MMCEHELKQALLDIEFLQECNNSANLALSVTRKELAAANARVAELETDMAKAITEIRLQVTEKLSEKQRAEKAEARLKGEKQIIDTIINYLGNFYEKTEEQCIWDQYFGVATILTMSIDAFAEAKADIEKEKVAAKLANAMNKITMLEAEIVRLREAKEQADAHCAAMRNCHNCKNYDMQWDNDGDWVQRCKHNDTEHDACGKLMKWEAEGNG